ncbi:MAG TPA: hypothetical protein PLF40_01760 [Kofleriaceae bacterium]|nr:hypothetical protein [Kofleriaceae bacterium]
MQQRPHESDSGVPDHGTLPVALLGALFVSDDGKLACQTVRGDHDHGDNAPFRTTVWAGIGGPVLAQQVYTRWHPAKAPHAERASERLGLLQVELDAACVGDVYNLYVVQRNQALTAASDKEWIAAGADTPLDELRLFPEFQSSPFTPADWDWDWRSGWWYPYATFRAATAAELLAHATRG